MTGNLSVDAVAVRVEGRDAARSGATTEACPYGWGDWRLLEWRIGHVGFAGPVSPALLRQAYNARRRAARRRDRKVEAAARPEFTGNLCKLASCRGPIAWKKRISKGRNLAREFCSPKHQHEHLTVTAAERRSAAAAGTAQARKAERAAVRRREKREALREALHGGAPLAAAAPARAARPPNPVTELMLRLAVASETEGGCRAAGLTPEQVAGVMALQRGVRSAAA